jgi:hypothetical protein
LPQSLIPREIAPENGSGVELVSSVVRWRNAEKNRQKRINTRENGLRRASVTHWMRRDRLARCIVVPGSSSRRSFSLLKVSQKCSQLIHITFVSASPAGLRVEITFKTDKKKMNKK